VAGSGGHGIVIDPADDHGAVAHIAGEMNAEDVGAVFRGEVRLMDEREATTLAPDGLGRLVCLYELGGASVLWLKGSDH